jgi:YHS domain-containing protein
MKKYLFYAAFAAITFSFGCSQQTKTTDNTPTSTEQKKINVSVSQLATTTDLSCGMKFTSDGQIGDTMTYNGKLYGFCSKECRDNFASDPQKFINKQ